MLVIETTKLADFINTLKVLGPTHSKAVLEFVEEIVTNAKSMEIELKVKRSELMKLKEAFEEEIEKQDKKIVPMQPDVPSEDEHSIYEFAGDDEPAF